MKNASRSEADRRAEEVIARWRDEREDGDDPEEVLRANPDLEPELRDRLEVLSLLKETAAGLSLPERVGVFRIEQELGIGGMGIVYRAVAEERAPGVVPGETVALKVIHPHLLGQPGFFRRFVREAEHGRKVEHENVVRTRFADAEVTPEAARHFLVMEHVEGRTLRELLADLERVPEELCRHVGREIARGLSAVHAAGIVHRDLKPENVLITSDHVVKIMDLGVARLADERMRLSRTGGFVGSVLYAAPEQFGGEVDARTDLHALGVLLYELSTGSHPYDADDHRDAMRKILESDPLSPGEVNPQLSPFFEEFLKTLMEKEPDRRIATADQVARLLSSGEESEWWHDRSRAIRVETKRPLRRIRIPRETKVHGREEELERLREIYGEVRHGKGRAVLVEGEAGIGKTRLVDELVRRLAAEGEEFHFLYGSYPPGGAATTAGAWSTAYREHFGEEDLEERVGPYLEESAILVPAFAALLRGEPAPEGAEPLTKDSLQTAFVRVTRSLAREKPTVFLIDDLHFAPEEARALFTSLALAVPDHRILLVGTARPEVPEDWRGTFDRVEQAERLPLPRLGPKDLGDLFREFFRSDRLAEELGWRIAMKSDGNPFFAFEIIRGLIEGQLLHQRPDGTWDTTGVIEEIEIPSTVLDLVNARTADLGDDERNLLDVASCVGFTFDPLLAADALGLDRLTALQLLGRIEKRHRLVHSAGREFVFDHHQVKEVLYDALSKPLRETYHARIAEALEVQTGAVEVAPEELDGALCVELSEHYLKGARGEQALRYLKAAQEHLTKGYLHAQVVALSEWALKVPDLLTGVERAKTLLRMASALDPMGRRERQEKCAREAEGLAEEAGDVEVRGLAARALGVVFLRTSLHEEAEAAFRRALDLAVARADSKGEAIATGKLGEVFRAEGRLAEAREHFERHLALSREIGDRQGEARATGNLGNVFWAEGRLAEAREHLERHLALSREIGDRQGEACATGNLGLVFLREGRLAEAREHHVRHLALSREIGYRQGEALATGNLGIVFRAEGRLTESREHLERYLALSREIGYKQGEAIALGRLGQVFRDEGRLAEAREHFERHLALSREIGERQGEASATGNLGIVFWAEGRLAESREHLERYLALSREIGDKEGEAVALINLAEILGEGSDQEAAREPLLAGLSLCEESGFRPMEAAARCALGALLVAGGDAASGRESLEAARDLAAEIGSAGVETLARCHLACLPGGDAEDALAAFAGSEGRMNAGWRREAHWLLFRATGDREHLDAARRLLDEEMAHVDEETRESMLTHLRLNREIATAAKEAGL